MGTLFSSFTSILLVILLHLLVYIRWIYSNWLIDCLLSNTFRRRFWARYLIYCIKICSLGCTWANRSSGCMIIRKIMIEFIMWFQNTLRTLIYLFLIFVFIFYLSILDYVLIVSSWIRSKTAIVISYLNWLNIFIRVWIFWDSVNS